MNYKRTVWHIALWANWALILGFWWNGSGDMMNQGATSVAVALGRLAGLSAAYMILLQFFFMGRTPWLERVFGLDKLSRIHHTNGKWGLIMLLMHPLLLTWGYGKLSGATFKNQFVSFLTEYEHVWLAGISLMLFIIVVGSSLYIVRKKLRYEAWYFVHLFAYLAVFSSFFHQIKLGTTLLSSNIFYMYWLALYTFVFANHLVFRFARPVYNFYKHRFVVSRVVRENYNTVSVYISGKDLSSFNIYPGQFMILRFLSKGLWWQSHPFSLSIIPDGKELRVTIKELGDFTKQVAQVIPGTQIMIDGPYGVFTELFSVSPKVLFIAGGIGITPIRSLFEQLTRKGKDAVLLYGNRAEKDIVFKSELETVAQTHGGEVVHVLSDDPSYAGEKGYLDQDKIKRLVPDLADREIFLCGPTPMMDGVIKSLRALGVPLHRIHFERFSL